MVAPGGYAWWYLDALSDDGRQALVLIGFVGSVFSPFYYRARRRNPGTDAYAHSALNVALYGGPARWAFTEYGRGAVSCRANQLTLGGSQLRWNGQGLECLVNERCAPLPGGLRGLVRLEAPALTGLCVPLARDGSHLWRPLAPHARVSVEFEQPRVRWQGSGYLDSNEGTGPLESAFSRWSWLRARGADSTTIIYDVQPCGAPRERHALRVSARGAVEPFSAPPPVPLPRSRWGIAQEAPADPGCAPRLQMRLEDAPFYSRSLVATRLCGEAVTAVHESLSLTRFHSPWVRCLLPFRMRRSSRWARTTDTNS
ncbi:MAG: carotenoid 1,2-hydratase [Proteobacteria bacterium]|nr:carotenoid 1,2-hydratase [Pseudomonadota bacterium]